VMARFTASSEVLNLARSRTHFSRSSFAASRLAKNAKLPTWAL